MSWRILVRHRTGYAYAAPVRSSYNEARMTPPTRDGQQTLETRLDVSPGVTPMRYVDYWKTIVHAFDVHVPHTELIVTAAAVVETADPRPAVTDAPGWAAFEDPGLVDRHAELLVGSTYVVAEAEVTEVAAGLVSSCDPTAAGHAAARWAHEQLTYQRGATAVHTTSAQARAEGRGVCQDYAHLTLAVLRAMTLPARYVSGYLHPTRDAAIGEQVQGESHAWVEFWAGDWVAVDPTSLDPVGERHIAVARGRDYADVRPLAGTYRGPRAQSLDVTVGLTRLR